MATTYSRNRARLAGCEAADQPEARLASARAIAAVNPALFLPGRLAEAMDGVGTDAVRLSEATGIGRKSISSLRNGTHLPRSGDLAVLAVALGVSADWLLGIDER